SRRRIAGGERRFGTMSIYMDAMYAIRPTAEVSHCAAYMGTSKRRHKVPRRTNPRKTAILPVPRHHKIAELRISRQQRLDHAPREVREIVAHDPGPRCLGA